LKVKLMNIFPRVIFTISNAYHIYLNISSVNNR
jgi:hypothetical protein